MFIKAGSVTVSRLHRAQLQRKVERDVSLNADEWYAMKLLLCKLAASSIEERYDEVGPTVIFAH